jgi:heme-degrading monooxygenase HmoA
MVIERVWRGIAKTEQAAQYLQHLEQETFPKIRRLKGYINARVLRRDLDDRVEFLVITTWASMEAITDFAGKDVETAVVPPDAKAALIEYDNHVTHYEVVNI